METIFLRLLNLSIQASLLIVVIMLLRVIFKKTPKSVKCLLWGLVAVRLVFPFSIESSYSLAPSSELVEINTYTDNDADVITGSEAFDYELYGENIYHVEDSAPAKGRQIEPMKLFSFVWLAGMFFLAVYAIASYLNIWKRTRLSINTQENIYLCDSITSPFIYGILRPRIYLPSQITKEQRESVIAHEKAHIKRLDHLWKPLGFLLLMIYWFNPLCWVAYFLLCKDIELACDERVIKHMNTEQKKSYSKALLSFSEPRKMITACPLAFGEVGVKERVKSILDYKKPAFWITVLAILAIITTSFFFLTSPKKSTYDLTFRIPARCVDQMIYADEEISPVKNKEFSFLVGHDVGDTLINISCVEGMAENDYESSYITPGMDTKLKAQKEEWYRVGIRAWNDTAQEKTVHVRVKNAQIRIASNSEPSLENVQMKERLEVSSPTIDLSAPTGADGSFMYYADKDKFIFGGCYGLFVYDVTLGQIVRSLDLEPIGCNFTQGDNACEIAVTQDGSKVFLRPLARNMMYVYSVKDNQLTIESDNLEGYVLYQSQVVDLKAASFVLDGETRIYCLVNDTTIGELGYAMDAMSSYHKIFDDSEQTSTEYINRQYEERDGHYIVDGDMVYRYKKILTGIAPTAKYPTQFTVLTNDEDVTWEKVWRSLISSSSADWLSGTEIVSMKKLEYSIPDSCWPTVSYTISGSYGTQDDKNPSDHINIAGVEGDSVFAVADGVVVRQEYDEEDGNVITLDVGNNTLVVYGHLKECMVSEGDSVSKGQVIATLGNTGMSTGPNLKFAVYIDGKSVNPIKE